MDLTNLKIALRNLHNDFGNTDNTQLAIVVNVGLALLGVVVFLFTSGIISYIAAVWAILNILPVIQWVIGV